MALVKKGASGVDAMSEVWANRDLVGLILTFAKLDPWRLCLVGGLNTTCHSVVKECDAVLRGAIQRMDSLTKTAVVGFLGIHHRIVAEETAEATRFNRKLDCCYQLYGAAHVLALFERHGLSSGRRDRLAERVASNEKVFNTRRPSWVLDKHVMQVSKPYFHIRKHRPLH